MKMKQINEALEQIAQLKSQLSGMSNLNTKKQLEEQIQQLESAFDSEYQSEMYEILLDVHDELCPDNEVQKPSNYLASSYRLEGASYLVNGSEGLDVHMDDYPHDTTKLVLLPSPLRIQLNINEGANEEVWSAERNQYAY